MNKIEIERENVIAAHLVAGSKTRKVLETLFGQKVFKPLDVTERIKTLSDAEKEIGRFAVVDMTLTKDERAYHQLKIIAEALNEGWKPNWNDSNERKFYPWFSMTDKPGFGFSYTCCGWARTYTDVGSRLCFKSEKLAAYAGKQFESIYKDFLTL